MDPLSLGGTDCIVIQASFVFSVLVIQYWFFKFLLLFILWHLLLSEHGYCSLISNGEVNNSSVITSLDFIQFYANLFSNCIPSLSLWFSLVYHISDGIEVMQALHTKVQAGLFAVCNPQAHLSCSYICTIRKRKI